MSDIESDTFRDTSHRQTFPNITTKFPLGNVSSPTMELFNRVCDDAKLQRKYDKKNWTELHGRLETLLEEQGPGVAALVEQEHLLGQAVALEAIPQKFLDRAACEFISNRDEMAQMFRHLAKEFKGYAQEARKAYFDAGGTKGKR